MEEEGEEEEVEVVKDDKDEERTYKPALKGKGGSVEWGKRKYGKAREKEEEEKVAEVEKEAEGRI